MEQLLHVGPGPEFHERDQSVVASHTQGARILPRNPPSLPLVSRNQRRVDGLTSMESAGAVSVGAVRPADGAAPSPAAFVSVARRCRCCVRPVMQPVNLPRPTPPSTATRRHAHRRGDRWKASNAYATVGVPLRYPLRGERGAPHRKPLRPNRLLGVRVSGVQPMTAAKLGSFRRRTRLDGRSCEWRRPMPIGPRPGTGAVGPVSGAPARPGPARSVRPNGVPAPEGGLAGSVYPNITYAIPSKISQRRPGKMSIGLYRSAVPRRALAEDQVGEGGASMKVLKAELSRRGRRRVAAATITSLGDEVKALGGLVTRDLAPPRRAPSLEGPDRRQPQALTGV